MQDKKILLQNIPSGIMSAVTLAARNAELTKSAYIKNACRRFVTACKERPVLFRNSFVLYKKLFEPGSENFQIRVSAETIKEIETINEGNIVSTPGFYIVALAWDMMT